MDFLPLHHLGSPISSYECGQIINTLITDLGSSATLKQLFSFNQRSLLLSPSLLFFSFSYHFYFRSSCLHGFALESSIRVVWRNRTSKIYSCVYSFRYGKICYGELAHAVMEAEKSYNVLSASWRPREASGIIPVWVWMPESQGSGWYNINPSPRAGEDQSPSSNRQTGSKGDNSFFRCLFFPIQVLKEWCSLTLERAIYFTVECPDSNVILIRNILTYTPNNNFSSGSLLALLAYSQVDT